MRLVLKKKKIKGIVFFSLILIGNTKLIAKPNCFKNAASFNDNNISQIKKFLWKSQQYISCLELACHCEALFGFLHRCPHLGDCHPYIMAASHKLRPTFSFQKNGVVGPPRSNGFFWVIIVKRYFW